MKGGSFLSYRLWQNRTFCSLSLFVVSLSSSPYYDDGNLPLLVKNVFFCGVSCGVEGEWSGLMSVWLNSLQEWIKSECGTCFNWCGTYLNSLCTHLNHVEPIRSDLDLGWFGTHLTICRIDLNQYDRFELVCSPVDSSGTHVKICWILFGTYSTEVNPFEACGTYSNRCGLHWTVSVTFMNPYGTRSCSLSAFAKSCGTCFNLSEAMQNPIHFMTARKPPLNH